MMRYAMRKCPYAYDDFNRLNNGDATTDGALGLGCTYDSYANRGALNATGNGNIGATQPHAIFHGNTDRLDVGSFDAAGDMFNKDCDVYVYNAKGRIVTLSGDHTYSYDFAPQARRSG